MIPWRLLVFILIVAVLMVFIGFNLDNRCDISIVFITFQSVPVVITILATYVLGLLSAFFLTVTRRVKSKTRSGKQTKLDDSGKPQTQDVLKQSSGSHPAGTHHAP